MAEEEEEEEGEEPIFTDVCVRGAFSFVPGATTEAPLPMYAPVAHSRSCAVPLLGKTQISESRRARRYLSSSLDASGTPRGISYGSGASGTLRACRRRTSNITFAGGGAETSRLPPSSAGFRRTPLLNPLTSDFR